MNNISNSVNAFLLVYAGLFPIVNPVGSAPIFLRLTQYNADQRGLLARGVASNSFLLLLGSLVHRLASAGILRHHAADRAHRRRPRGGGVRLEAAARRRRTRRSRQRPGRQARDLCRHLLSADDAADGRAGLDLGRGHPRQSATACVRRFCATRAAGRRRDCRARRDRATDLRLLPLCRRASSRSSASAAPMW